MGNDPNDIQSNNKRTIIRKDITISPEEAFLHLQHSLHLVEVNLHTSHPSVHTFVPQEALERLHKAQLDYVDSVLGAHYRPVREALDSYTEQLLGLQQPIITNTSLTHANKSNLLTDAARSLQKEELSIAKQKQDFAHTASCMDGVKETVLSYQNLISSQLIDLQLNITEPQKLPLYREALESLIKCEKTLVSVLHESISTSGREKPSLETFNSSCTAALDPYLQQASNIAEEHELTVSTSLTACRKKLSQSHNLLEPIGKSGDTSLQTAQKKTKQSLMKGIGSLQNAIYAMQDYHKNSTGNHKTRKKILSHLHQATEHYNQASLHANQLEHAETLTKTAANEQKALQAACEADLKALSQLMPEALITHSLGYDRTTLHDITVKIGRILLNIWRFFFKQCPPLPTDASPKKITPSLSPEAARNILHNRANEFEGLGLMTKEPPVSPANTIDELNKKWQVIAQKPRNSTTKSR